MRVSGKWLIVVLLSVGVTVGAVYWWWAGGGRIVREMLTPRFRVLAVDFTAQTVQLRQTNRTYTVRCGDACREFVPGSSYAARDRGSDLEIHVGRRRVLCPVIKIEVQFDLRPGGVGAYLWSKNTTGAYRIRCGVRMATARALLS